MKSFALLFFVFITLFPSDALACACCADAGYYRIGARKLSDLEMDELKKIRFGAPTLFADDGFPDTAKGINPIGDNYSLSASLQNKIWRFDFKDDAGKIGTLNLEKPLSMIDYAVDLREDKANSPGEVRLYKEWRFKYRVKSASGVFAKGFAPGTEYFLVLQGRGNVCTEAENFTDWRVEITGKRASYAFFGKLISGKPATE